MKEQNLNRETDLFRAERRNGVVMLTFKGGALLSSSSLSNKEEVFDYLDLLAQTDSVKVVTITHELKRSPRDEYFEFYNLLSESKMEVSSLFRMWRAYDQLIARIVNSEKLFLGLGQGEMVLQDFSTVLACDHKVVADNTVIHKPYLELGLVSKGGAAYFLKKLGHSRAYEILLSNKSITAHEALQLGIVNEVVPYDELQSAALKTAQRFEQNSVTLLSETKKLLNYSLKDLEDYLEFENHELWKIITRSPRFKAICVDTGFS